MSWMTLQEAEDFGLFEPCNERGIFDSLLIGFSQKTGRYMWYRGDGHSMIVAPPGSGKGQGFVLPNCVLYPGSMLVVDPKGENAGMTANHRRNNLKQAVHVIDPFGLSGQPQASFNPLDWLKTTEPKFFFEDCNLLAEALVAHEAAQYAHFHDEAVNLMRGLILYLFAHEPNNLNLNRLHDLAFGDLEHWYAIFELMAESEAEHDGIRRMVRSAGNWYLGVEQKSQDQHRNTVQKNVQWLGGIEMPNHVETSSFDVKRLKTEPTTIYLCLPGDMREMYKPYVRSLVTLSLLGMYRTRGAPEVPVQFMCDEFYTTIGSLDIVDKAAGDMRGYGARFAFVFQEFSQLKKLYPDTWQLFESSSGVAIYIGAENDTAEHVSRRLGPEEYVERPGASFFTGGDVISRAPHMGRRPVMTSQQIKLLGTGKEIVFVQHRPALLCDRVTAWRDNNFAPFLDPNPMH